MAFSPNQLGNGLLGHNIYIGSKKISDCIPCLFNSRGFLKKLLSSCRYARWLIISKGYHQHFCLITYSGHLNMAFKYLFQQLFLCKALI